MNADFAIQRSAMAAQRSAMIDSQLRTVGVNAPDVLAAIAAVPREQFVPVARAALAYVDGAVALGGGRYMMEPMILGLLLTHLRIAPGEKVLVVGAATGYAAAVIAALGATVTAVESDAALAAQAKRAGVAVIEAPLAAGHAAAAPYDVLFIDGAVPQLPATLAAQLRDGGRVGMVLIGDDGVGRATVGRVAAGHFGGASIMETAATPLPGFEAPARFIF